MTFVSTSTNYSKHQFLFKQQLAHALTITRGSQRCFVHNQSQKMKNIGVTLKSLRVEKGYTLRQVAEKAQMPFSHLSNIENGKKVPGLDLIDRICFALGVPLKHVILKSELEREFKEDRKILLKDLQPYFRKIDAIAKQIYNSDNSNSNDDDDNGIFQEVVTPIIQGGSAQELQGK